MSPSTPAVPRQDVRFRSGNDECAAWLFLPDSTDAQAKPPVVVMAHGFAATRQFALAPYAEAFAAAGLAVLVFDYRRFGASSGEPRQLINVQDQLDDWAAALAWARACDAVDGTRLAVWGSSFSGGHVLVTAARDGNVRAVVSQVPFVDGRGKTPYRPPVMQLLRLLASAVWDAVGGKLGMAPYEVPVVAPAGQLAMLSAPDCFDGYLALVPDDALWTNGVPARSLFSLASYRPTQSAAEINCPVLVQAARHDSLIALEDIEGTAAKIPQATLQILETGHFDPYHQQPPTAQVEFLTKHLLGRVRE